MPLVFAQSTTTTTTEVQRVVGDPLPTWEFWAAGVVVLAFIVLGGLWFSRRSKG